MAKSPKLRVKGVSETAEIKDNIQALLRDIVMLRDGGCLLRYVQGLGSAFPFGIPFCNGYRQKRDGTLILDDNGEPQLILQADHLLPHSNSATYADSRLVVCVCKGHHGWKSVGNDINKTQYDAVVRTLLPPDRVALWDKCEAEHHRTQSRQGSYDWRLYEAALSQELKQLQANQNAL
jgi:hypothetical protein